jgi:hypothetical protein
LWNENFLEVRLLGRSKGKNEWRRLVINTCKPQRLSTDIDNAVTALDEEAQKCKELNSYLYGHVNKKVNVLDKAFRLVCEPRTEDRSLQHDRYAKGGETK